MRYSPEELQNESCACSRALLGPSLCLAALKGPSMNAQGSLFLPGLKPWKCWFGLNLGSEPAVRKQRYQAEAEAEMSHQAESQI